MRVADRLDGYSRTRAHSDGTIIRIVIVRTADDAYPSGWRYTLHYGRVDGPAEDTPPDGTILRYDNVHEATKGHECHRGRTGETERVTFTGIEAVWRAFWDAIPKAEFDLGGEE